MDKTLSWTTPSPARHFAAAALRAASVALDRMARRVAAQSAALPRLPTMHGLEFHAEAGAPEGALYVDGELVGRVPGVTRL